MSGSRRLAAMLTLALAWTSTPQIDSPLYRLQGSTLTIVNPDGSVVELKTVVVESATDRARGLMHVRHLPANMSMLFINEHDRITSMWMKNTIVSLDMWFIDARGRITQINRWTEPHSLESQASTSPVRAVVEVNAGLSTKLGVSLGSWVKHDAFDSRR